MVCVDSSLIRARATRARSKCSRMKTIVLFALLMVIAGTLFITLSKERTHTQRDHMNSAEIAANIQETKRKFRESLQNCHAQKKAVVAQAAELISRGQRQAEQGKKKLEELDTVLRQNERQCREEQERFVDSIKSAYKRKRLELEQKCREEEEAVAAKYRAEISRVRGMPDEDRVHNNFLMEKNASIRRCSTEQAKLSDEALRVHFEISSEQ